MAELSAADLPRITVNGEDFVDEQGKAVRFWGVNLIACYPEHAAADALAANLASLQVNLARPHHLLRPSYDWNPGMTSGSLALYQGDSRAFDPEAFDKFDYLNAALRGNGIYLALPLNGTREFRAGDVDILQTDEADRKAWVKAVEELNARDWRQSIDVYKMLPAVDERAALLSEEFVRKLLTHVNPYTGTAYGADSQVVTLEVMNEASTEYAVICANRFPDYWHNKLVAKWESFAKAHGIEPGDLYQPRDAAAVAVRARFLRKLDEDYFERIKAVVRESGCRAPLEFSNLWRGENALQMAAEKSDFIETHMYMDPDVVSGREDGFYEISKTQVEGKPFLLGELNQAEGEENIRKQAPARSMLMLASSAYGSLQGWSGIVWFAWLHGCGSLGQNGWSDVEGRSAELGRMMNDGMMIDHLRTAGIIFRRGLVDRSRSPLLFHVKAPFVAGDYNGLMQGKVPYQPGWQNIHGIRKTFATGGQGPDMQSWMEKSPENPLVSDTGQITKDTELGQLCLSTPQAEGFSGRLNGKSPASLKHLQLDGSGFATVILVSDDDLAIGESRRMIVSKTSLDGEGVDQDALRVSVLGLARPSEGKHWRVRITRPRGVDKDKESGKAGEEVALTPSEDGGIELPSSGWHECELSLQ